MPGCRYRKCLDSGGSYRDVAEECGPPVSVSRAFRNMGSPVVWSEGSSHLQSQRLLMTERDCESSLRARYRFRRPKPPLLAVVPAFTRWTSAIRHKLVFSWSVRTISFGSRRQRVDRHLRQQSVASQWRSISTSASPVRRNKLSAFNIDTRRGATYTGPDLRQSSTRASAKARSRR